LAADGSKVGRRHVKTLMPKMGIEALYRRTRGTGWPTVGSNYHCQNLEESSIKGG
jgi:putative transposase